MASNRSFQNCESLENSSPFCICSTEHVCLLRNYIKLYWIWLALIQWVHCSVVDITVFWKYLQKEIKQMKLICCSWLLASSHLCFFSQLKFSELPSYAFIGKGLKEYSPNVRTRESVFSPENTRGIIILQNSSLRFGDPFFFLIFFDWLG